MRARRARRASGSELAASNAIGDPTVDALGTVLNLARRKPHPEGEPVAVATQPVPRGAENRGGLVNTQETVVLRIGPTGRQGDPGPQQRPDPFHLAEEIGDAI